MLLEIVVVMILQRVEGVISAKVGCTGYNKTPTIKSFSLNFIGPSSVLLRVPYPKRASGLLSTYTCAESVFLAVFTQVYGTYFLMPVPNG